MIRPIFPTAPHDLGRVAVALGLLIAVGACGSDDPASSVPPREVTLEMFEFGFRSDDAITIAVGDTVAFDVRNAGTIVHQMELLNANSTRLGMTDRLAAGATETVTVTFDESGVYTLICDIDDHRSNGHLAEFTVAEPAGE